MNKQVVNDYGDIPRWYRGPAFLRPRRPRSRRAIAAIAMAIMLACCHQVKPPVVVTPPPPGLDGPATCLDYCRRGAQLGCAWAADTPAGKPCVDVCANYQEVSQSPMDLNCRVGKSTCADVDACP